VAAKPLGQNREALLGVEIGQERYEEHGMSKAFIASVIQESAELSAVAAHRAASDLMDSIVREMKKSGGFTLPSFGTFRVVKTKARKGLNPRTGEAIKVKAGKTVRFKASPTLKKAV
jgi:DNA-binding protein HU-beta